MTYDPQTLREVTIRALQHHRGDNGARAKAAFRNCTLEEMGQEYGQSGRTRAQILEEYLTHEARVDAAIKWVEGKL